MPLPPNWNDLSYSQQRAYITSQYGDIKERARQNETNPLRRGGKFLANVIRDAPWISADERELWSNLKKPPGTWLGNAFSEAAPYALVAGTIATGLSLPGGPLAAGGSTASTAAGGGTGLGVFSNSGAAGLAGVGGGNAGALAASGAIAGGAGVGGTAAGALGGFSALANSVSGVGRSSMGWMDWVPSLVSAGASLIGSRQANNATAAATRQAIDEQRRQFDLVRSDTAGQRALGDAAISTLANVSGYNESGTPDFSAFYADPGRAYAISEGQNAIDRSLVARGGALSGQAVKEGVRHATGMADQQYSAWYDRLLQQAGIGSTGIGASAASGANAANNIGAAAINGGNARASTYMNNAANINNSIQSGVQNYMLRRYLGA